MAEAGARTYRRRTVVMGFRRWLPLLLVAIAVAACSVPDGVGTTPSMGSPSWTSSAAAATHTKSPVKHSAAPEQNTGTATVEKIVDGDTIQVVVDRNSTAFDLAYVRAPKAASGNATAECLSVQAEQLLARIVPVGTRVQLRSLGASSRPTGSTAVVLSPKGRNVSVMIAEAGLGIAAVSGKASEAAIEVRSAQQRGRRS